VGKNEGPQEEPEGLEGIDPRSLRVLTMDPTERFRRLGAENRLEAKGERHFHEEGKKEVVHCAPQRRVVAIRACAVSGTVKKPARQGPGLESPVTGLEARLIAGTEDA